MIMVIVFNVLLMIHRKEGNSSESTGLLTENLN